MQLKEEWGLSSAHLDAIADALIERGYIVLDQAIPTALVSGLGDEFNRLHPTFKRAGIGRKDNFQLADSIRSDQIHWISATHYATTNFLQWMEALRCGMNQRLFLGLFDYESHFAHYPVGAFYKKHVDAFKGQGNRILSTVLYLNEAWDATWGGELVLYAEGGEQVLEKISPIAGRLVIFLSEVFPHEVLPAERDRKSIAGWFRVNQL